MIAKAKYVGVSDNCFVNGNIYEIKIMTKPVIIEKLKGLGLKVYKTYDLFLTEWKNIFEMNVKFRVLELVDSVKQNSELIVGNVYHGQLSADGKTVYYRDKAEVDWIFYVDDTCEIVN